MPPNHRYQPFALIGITLLVLAGFAVFFVGFLIAPLAILAIFYLIFASLNRSRPTNGDQQVAPPRPGPPPPGASPTGAYDQRLRTEAEARRHQIQREDAYRHEMSSREDEEPVAGQR
jgi:hypothetical protein